MCEPTTIALALTAVTAAVSAKGAYDQGQVSKQVGRNNQIMAEYAAQDAVRRGEDEALAARRKGDQIKGAARANMAAKGLDLSSGTAADLQDQTDFFSENDQNMARFNAQRDAWAARSSGNAAAAQGDAAARQGSLSAFGTVLGAGSQVASRWGDFTIPKGGSSFGGTDPTGGKYSATGADVRARR
jgi:hypothetical protein